MNRLSDIFQEKSLMDFGKESFYVKGYNDLRKNVKVNVLAMGDVGSTLVLALKLMGNDIISQIGICDINRNVLSRFETEFNQISMPLEYDNFPKVVTEDVDKIFDCDVFVFCASKGVPPVGNEQKDVRMVQLENNLELVKAFAEKAVNNNYKGEFFVVSDPVDPLCKGALLAGVKPHQIQGFGLGVMNGRAAYYAKKDLKFSEYLREGRAFGPHGNDLVIANSIYNYNEDLSNQLTKLTVESNIRTRKLGFKPYIAPAVSSGAISILENLRGNWHYSSLYFGKERKGAFLGVKNKRKGKMLEVENLPLDEKLYEKILKAYNNLQILI